MLFSVALLSGCGSKENQSVVNIPATADTKDGKASKADPNGPKIQFDHTSYDFGNVTHDAGTSKMFQ